MCVDWYSTMVVEALDLSRVLFPQVCFSTKYLWMSSFGVNENVDLALVCVCNIESQSWVQRMRLEEESVAWWRM